MSILYTINNKLVTINNKFIQKYVAPEYSITIGASTNGSVSASSLTATEGTTITLTASADTGYELDYFTLNGVALASDSFVMPASNVTVSAVFVASGPTFDEVTIGSQTWMSKNLAIDDGQGGISTQTVNYGDGDVTEYYYTFDAAVRVASTVDGWHLPSYDEFNTLATYLGSNPGTKLKSTNGWSSGNGTDDFGFKGLPAGVYMPGYGQFGSKVGFWSSTGYPGVDVYAYYRYLYTGNGFTSDAYWKSYLFSVRLVKDS